MYLPELSEDDDSRFLLLFEFSAFSSTFNFLAGGSSSESLSELLLDFLPLDCEFAFGLELGFLIVTSSSELSSELLLSFLTVDPAETI